MLIKQYAHRLPADYDMQRIRDRAVTRGPDWDETAGLVFKAFLMRERDRNGAAGNVYASVYLWRDPVEAAAFLTGPRFLNVVATFGRPRIETWLPLDVQLGTAPAARWLLREDACVPDGTDLAAFRRDEITGNAAIIQRAGTLAVFSGLDLAAWRLSRFTLSAERPSASGTCYEILYLAAPGREQRAEHPISQETTSCL